MFGYVRAYKPDLTFRQYDVYKGVYCSLCKTIGRRYGLAARLTLSYDFAFFALVRFAVRDVCVPFRASRCSFCPTKKCLQCDLQNSDLCLTADISMLMVYYKYLDNLRDGKRFRRILLKLVSPFFRRIFQKAKKNAPEAAVIMQEMFELQCQTERQPAQIDAAAHPSAQALGRLLTLDLPCENRELLYRFGYAVGRWVYLTDAADDYADDRKSGNFNPFLSVPQEEAKQTAERAINLTAGEAASLLEQLGLRRFRAIISNVIYDGMHHAAYRVLYKEKGEQT